jgi:hypothetical protein
MKSIMMTAPFSLNDVLARWAFNHPPASWVDAWPRVAGSQPAVIPFLAESAIGDSARFCGMSDEIQTVLLQAAAIIRADPLMAQTAWFLHAQYFGADIPAATEVWNWPFVSQYARGEAALIPALVLLAGVPRLREQHQTRHIPESITRDTLADIEIWIHTYRRQQGEWGLNNMAWLTHAFAGRLFRLGRLQFGHKPFTAPVHAFEHRVSGRVVALSGSEVKIRCDGFVDGTNEDFDPQAFHPLYNPSAESVTGHPIHPRGWVLPRPITLSLLDWNPILHPGDPILDIHIPESGPMDFDQCGESLRQALDFFPRYYPEWAPARAFACGTWFFDFQYQKILPPSSNIVRVQREFYLYPLFSYDREAFRRVFGSPPADLDQAPRHTALQRALIDFTKAGGRLRCAGGFLPIPHLAWGTARFQTDLPDPFP